MNTPLTHAPQSGQHKITAIYSEAQANKADSVKYECNQGKFPWWASQHIAITYSLLESSTFGFTKPKAHERHCDVSYKQVVVDAATNQNKSEKNKPDKSHTAIPFVCNKVGEIAESLAQEGFHYFTSFKLLLMGVKRGMLVTSHAPILTHAPQSGNIKPHQQKTGVGFDDLSDYWRLFATLHAWFFMSKHCGTPSGVLVPVGQFVNLQSLGHHFDEWFPSSTMNYWRAAMSANTTSISKELSQSCHRAIEAVQGVAYAIADTAKAADTNQITQAKLTGQAKAIECLAFNLSQYVIGLETSHRQEAKRLRSELGMLQAVNEEVA